MDNLGDMKELPDKTGAAAVDDEEDIDAPDFSSENNQSMHANMNGGFLVDEATDTVLECSTVEEALMNAGGLSTEEDAELGKSSHGTLKSSHETLKSSHGTGSVDGSGISDRESIDDDSVFVNIPTKPSWKCSPTSSDPIPPSSSLFIFSADNQFRVICHGICSNKIFRSVVLLCILVSSGLLAAIDPLRHSHSTNQVSIFSAK